MILPRCVPVTCGAPPPVALGVVEQEPPYSVGEEARLRCAPGHTLVPGPAPLVCLHTGHWAATPPLCLPRLCSAPSSVEGGAVVTKAWTLEPLPEESLALLREQIAAKKLAAGPGVAVYPVGAELAVECRPGHQLGGGAATATCLDEDTWSGQLGRCSEVTCPGLAAPDHGSLAVEGFRYRQTVSYECELGHLLQPPEAATRVCEATGRWSGESPACVAVLCPDPEESLGAGLRVEVAGAEYGSLATYSCAQPGHLLLGGAERVCGPRGAWSGQQPVCAAPGDTCLVQRLATSGHVTLDTELRVGTREWHECTGPL